MSEGMRTITLVFPAWLSYILSGTFLAALWFLARQSKTLSEMCQEFPKMRRALDLISEKLVERKFFKDPVYVSSASPLHLTKEGRVMLEQSGFEEFFAANRDSIFREIARFNPKTPFDVEAAAKHVMLLHIDLQQFPATERVKAFAYQNGVQISDILFAYGIEVRDRYLDSHRETVPA